MKSVSRSQAVSGPQNGLHPGLHLAPLLAETYSCPDLSLWLQIPGSILLQIPMFPNTTGYLSPAPHLCVCMRSAISILMGFLAIKQKF